MNKKIVKFKETGNYYEVLKESALMKNPQTREWQDCVIYTQYADKDNNPVPEDEKLTFVRLKSEFDEKFINC